MSEFECNSTARYLCDLEWVIPGKPVFLSTKKGKDNRIYLIMLFGGQNEKQPSAWSDGVAQVILAMNSFINKISNN